MTLNFREAMGVRSSADVLGEREGYAGLAQGDHQ